MHAIWLIIVAFSALIVTYRVYGAFLAARVLVLNDSETTPAHRRNDGVDFHPTRSLVLFGHHFAAIAGSGPLIGPVLAAQWGYLPGFTWIIVGACLAGAVHDLVILAASVRYNGESLQSLARSLISPLSGFAAAIAIFFIIICVLASTGNVVVNTLGSSPWGVFTILTTIPAALITGFWMYRIRPGRLAEASLIGVSIVLLGVFLGEPFANSSYAHYLMFSKQSLSVILPIYTMIASILPVWLLMCPRDYLSSYMKIGVIFILGVCVVIINPELKMPALTAFALEGGPVISGKVLPFVCITIMCGALSGFHALVATGTTPKMINRERDILPIGFGAMLLESFVALMALIAACALEPGDYFAINIPQATHEQQVKYESFLETAKASGSNFQRVELSQLEAGVQESLEGRVGGAVTLAVGVAKIFSGLPGMEKLMAYWYHFLIMFEALFILTLIETGTRVARFIFQEALSSAFSRPKVATAIGKEDLSEKIKPNWTVNIVLSVVVSLIWGYLLYSGSLNVLWRLFGIANQLLAAIALMVGTIFILKHGRRKIYAFCTAAPLVFVVIIVGFGSVISIGNWFAELNSPALVGSARVFTNILCYLASLMVLLTAVVLIDGSRRCFQLIKERAA